MTDTSPPLSSAMNRLETAIIDLECRLGLKPGQEVNNNNRRRPGLDGNTEKSKKGKDRPPPTTGHDDDNNNNNENDTDLPDICKLEFKVGVVTKVWNHPTADKLYCEEIDVGEVGGPRQIASGLRPHFSLDEMLGQRLLVVSNLKAKNLVQFKSHGMVLCAKQCDYDDDNNNAEGSGGKTERVEFIEPPPGAMIGEIITFDGLPSPQPAAPSQVEKKKIFAKCQVGMKTDSSCLATWNGHVFLTSAGPCRAKTIAGGIMS